MKDLNLFKVKDSVFLREVFSREEALADFNCDGFLIRGGEKVCRSIIASLKDKGEKKIIAFVGGDDSLNRRAVESLDIDYLVSPEINTFNDTLKQRDSGMNHVVARIAAERGVGIVIDFGNIASLKGKSRAVRLGKIMQNVLLARKVGCRVLIASLALGKRDVVGIKGRQSFGVTLGMSSAEVRDSVLF